MTEPPPIGRRDPSSSSNPFADRLSAAIAQRGLSLHRIQSKLAAQDLKVSTATLSYWATGRSRPARARSQNVISALEVILGLPPGDLLGAMSGDSGWKSISELLPQAEYLPADLEEITRTQAKNWRRVMVHDVSYIGADHIETHTITTQVSRAEADQVDGWTSVVQAEPGQKATIQPLSGMTMQNFRTPEDRLTLAEVKLPRPLRRGESVLTSQRSDYGPGGQPTTRVGRAVPAVTDLLVLEVHFAGAPPRRIERSFTDPATGEVTLIARSLFIAEDQAHCVITNAAVGTHLLVLEW
ncbi:MULTISPECIES: helix-turn-helix domain-containing protein [unclassified Luteococcus]|uniref:helix-turn-helix domain-containing protein n=1 Tax=unclassified Luteococcus TaxID=2639923 RepID=UPI00313D04D3